MKRFRKYLQEEFESQAQKVRERQKREKEQLQKKHTREIEQARRADFAAKEAQRKQDQARKDAEKRANEQADPEQLGSVVQEQSDLFVVVVYDAGGKQLFSEKEKTKLGAVMKANNIRKALRFNQKVAVYHYLPNGSVKKVM
jgi:hypothetical protein